MLSRADEVLGRFIARVGPLRLTASPRFSPFEALASSIVYQQLNGKAAATILGRFREAVGLRGRFPDPQAVLAAPERVLRGAGLSRSKLAALRDLARKTLAGEVPSAAALRRMSDEEIIARLTQVRGIGPWTAQMLLIFRLGRPDVLPVTDYGVRQGFTQLYGGRELVSPAKLISHAERWRPYRSVASWYLWRVLDAR